MGGDFAPANVIRGSVDALGRDRDGLEILLVGPGEVLGREIPLNGGRDDLPLTVVQASEIITMDDGATAALKQKKDSSIAVGLRLQTEQRADAFVSAGNTGAVMSASTLILGRIGGVSRPTIGAFFPSATGVCLLVDAGANVDCKPRHLLEFGIMGSIYTSAMFGIEKPAVGLLNVGEEESKGTEAVVDAHALLKASGLNFIGNVEGRDILRGTAHVVVCDGFTGNVLLKFGESIPSFFKERINGYIADKPVRKLLMVPALGTFRSTMKSMDYEEYGGVPLLGVKGVSIIGHGKSTPKAIMNMILKAKEMVEKDINGRIEKAMVPA
jgi:glycerol-3-phosphate acyltransferase PlsX